MLECCKVARPRIVGRPKTRPAALKTAADLRKRVLLKSPVRETRTPGSVRGPPGNRRSYRDGASHRTEESKLGVKKVLIFDLSEVLIEGLYGVVEPLANRLCIPQHDACSLGWGASPW